VVFWHTLLFRVQLFLPEPVGNPGDHQQRNSSAHEYLEKHDIFPFRVLRLSAHLRLHGFNASMILKSQVQVNHGPGRQPISGTKSTGKTGLPDPLILLNWWVCAMRNIST
jgi:hypothetical protein